MIKPEQSQFRVRARRHQPCGAGVLGHGARPSTSTRGVLGMPLIKSLDLPGGMGQHFFFDAGNGDCVAFFWFADAPDRVPGISSPAAIPGIGDIVSAVSSMNHLAFHVPAEKFDEYRQRLKDKGCVSARCSTTTKARHRCRRPCTRASTCGRSTSTTPTASRSSSPAGSKNSPIAIHETEPKTAADRRPPVTAG